MRLVQKKKLTHLISSGLKYALQLRVSSSIFFAFCRSQFLARRYLLRHASEQNLSARFDNDRSSQIYKRHNVVSEFITWSRSSISKICTNCRRVQQTVSSFGSLYTYLHTLSVPFIGGKYMIEIRRSVHLFMTNIYKYTVFQDLLN